MEHDARTRARAPGKDIFKEPDGPAQFLRLLKSHNPQLGKPHRGGRGRGTPPEKHLPRPAANQVEIILDEYPADPGEPKQSLSELDGRVAAAGLSELAATEQCPHCSRRFSREAATRHVPICAGLKSRPKPPKEPRVYFTDALGRRIASPKAEERGFTMSTPSRSQKSAVENSEARGALKQQWSLVQFLLRDPLEALADDAAIIATAKSTAKSLEFLSTLEDYSAKLSMRKGALSRLLLPFNMDTDSGDQANSALEVPLGSAELDGLMTNQERQELVRQAVVLRRLVRVKVADCADVEQARDSLRLTREFLDALQRTAAEEKRSLTSILREL